MSKQVLFLFVVAFVYVQGAYGTGNTWTRKNDVGYPVKDFIEPATRSQAVAFSIGSKGYVGGGNIGLGQALQDFWAYDSLTGGWTQLASIPNNLANAVGFAVGTKGYVGTGYDSLGHVTKLFYQYDPAANTWARKADYAGGKRHDAVGFSLAGYGYIATGDSSIDNSGLCSDMWRYDTLADAWTQQAGFLGGARAGSVAFTIGGNAAYVGTGEVSGGFLRDFYEYNSNTSAWTVRASLPTGAQRTEAIGFSIGGTGYVCTGNNPNLTHPILDDFYEYNPTANTWAIGPVYGGHGRISGIAFSIGSRAYVGTGLNPSDVETGDMRCFDQNTGKWRGATPFGGVSNSTQSAFTIDSNAYAGGGGYCDLRKYSPGSDSWASAAFVIDTLRTGGVAFNIGNYGYTGMGVISGSYRSDFWQYNPTTDSWSQKASFPGGGRTGAAAFGIDTMGYVGMGTPSQLGANPYYDFWMYNPYVNTWALRDSFAGGPRQDMSTFVIGNGGYVTLGQDANNSHTDTWEYDAITGHWIARDSFPVFRNGAYSFSAGSKGYVGLGYAFSSFYEYDMVNNIWNQVANFPYISRSYGISFSVNGIGYIGLGSTGSNTDSTVLWQYEPNPSILSGNASDTTFCVGQTVTIPFYLGGVYANNNVFSLEISDSTGNFANGVTIGTLTSTRSGVITGVIPGNTHPANGYLIRVVSSNPAVTGTTVPGSFTIHTSVLPAITITPSANNVCSGTLISFTSSIQNGGATPTYQWTVNTVTKSTTNAYSSSTLNNNDTVKCVLTSSYFCAVPSTVYDTVIMKINTIPSSPVAVLGNDTLCVASPGTFSVAPVSGATSYIWQIPSGWSGTSTTDSITVTPNNSNGTILVWASNSCGISAQASESVYAARSPGPPQGNIAGSATVCAGSPQVYILPAVSGASSYIWTLPNGWTGSSLTDTISTVVGASSGNILVTASNVCGTGPPAIFAVSVTTAVPGQPGAIFGLANACSGTTQEYRSVQVFNATSYTWTIPASWTGASTVDSISTVIGLTGGTVQVTANNVCGSSSAQTLTVRVDTSVTPTLHITTPQTAVCAGSQVHVNAAFTNGGSAPTFQWLVNNTPLGSNIDSILLSPNSAESVICIMASSAVCATSPYDTSNTIQLTVSAYVTPTVNINVADTQICAGSSATFHAAATNGGTAPVYTWKVNGVSQNDTTNAYTTTTLANHAVVTCILQSNQNCATSDTANSNVINMLVDSIPVVSITAIDSTTFCAGDSAHLSATPGLTYTWTGGRQTAEITVTQSGSYDVTATDGNHCSATSSTIVVTVDTLPATPTITKSVDTLTSTLASSYQWYLNGNIITGATTRKIVITQNGQYSVKVSNSNNCYATSANFDVTTIGINEIFGSYDVKLYPNPNSGNFTLQFNDNVIREIEITDAIGRVVVASARVEKQKNFNLNELAAGIYILRITQNNEAKSLKFSVVK